MVIASKKTKASTIDVRDLVLRTLVSWESGENKFEKAAEESIRLLPKKNRPFFTELLKGTTRYKLFLDYKLSQILDHPLESLPSSIRNLLRVGGYQLEFAVIPKPVTVHLMVELAKLHGHPGTVGLVNGVLRRWAEGPAIELPQDEIEVLSVSYSHPRWFIDRWLPRFGKEGLIRLLEWNNKPPLIDLQVNPLRMTPEEVREMFAEHQIEVSPTFLEEALSFESGGSIESLPGFKEGLFWVQGVAAALPVYLLDPKPGEVILDLCSAPGGKACQIAAKVGDRAEIYAVDVDPDRLKKIEENRRRLGFHSILPNQLDGTKIRGDELKPADAILVDAPCSGTGVFRKRVDARWQKAAADLPHLAKTQLELLNGAVKLLKPGGRLVYSTCSLEREENQEVLERFLESHHECVLEDPFPYLPKTMSEKLKQKQGQPELFVETFPHEHELDGFFMARLTKKT